jgi:hypothetical protein
VRGKIHPLWRIIAVTAAAVDERLALTLSGPDSIAHLIEPHIEMITVHPVSERTPDEPVQEPDILTIPEGDGIVPIVLACGDLRKGIIDRGRQFFGGKAHFKIHDRRL